MLNKKALATLLAALAMAVLLVGPVLAQEEVLYGCSSRDPSVLSVLNPATGGATAVGDMGMTWCTGLAFDSNGNLFAVGWHDFGDDDWDPALYAVNPATGAATLIGRSSHLYERGIPDISFRSDDTLFGYLVHGEPDGLGTLNTATGEVNFRRQFIGRTG